MQNKHLNKHQILILGHIVQPYEEEQLLVDNISGLMWGILNVHNVKFSEKMSYVLKFSNTSFLFLVGVKTKQKQISFQTTQLQCSLQIFV